MKRPGSRSRVRWIVLGALALLAIRLTYIAYASPPRGPRGEVISPDEAAYTSQIIDNGIQMILATREEKGDHLYRRDAHAKTHGCVLADFTVVNTSGTPFHQGLFAKEETHKAWIRYSSGSTALQSDLAPDARGMAVKVLRVPGQKLLEGEELARTQDFVMINSPAFFIRNVEEYADLTRYQGQGSQYGYFFQGSLNPLKWRLREFRLGSGLLFSNWPPINLFGTRFYSMSAYKMGASNNVKYSAKPVSCGDKKDVPDEWAIGRNALREHLEQYIEKSPACFDFMAQLQIPDQDMPVEDTTVLWSEKQSPFVSVARIRIPPQPAAKNMENNFCENLSFTPWHSLPEHQPVGGLNRIRKAVYQGISRYRRCQNGIGFGEPKEDGSRQFEMGPCKANLPVPALTSGGATQ